MTLARKPEQAVRRLTQSGGYETDSRFSPRSRYVSFVREQNLYVIDLADGKERAVTRDGGGLISYGMAEFIAQEEMDRDTGYWWSPDERRIALARVDETPVAEVERFEIQATGASIVRQRYPATGAPMRASTSGRGPRAPTAACARPRARRRHLSTARRLVPGQPRPRRAAPEPRPEDARAVALRRAHGRGRC
jgi:dipeptidyl aminopeptidase/acylaminoacyl peptidase